MCANQIHGRASGLSSGSPQAWPRGWHPPALAPRPKAQRDAKGEPTPSRALHKVIFSQDFDPNHVIDVKNSSHVGVPLQNFAKIRL